MPCHVGRAAHKQFSQVFDCLTVINMSACPRFARPIKAVRYLYPKTTSVSTSDEAVLARTFLGGAEGASVPTNVTAPIVGRIWNTFDCLTVETFIKCTPETKKGTTCSAVPEPLTCIALTRLPSALKISITFIFSIPYVRTRKPEPFPAGRIRIPQVPWIAQPLKTRAPCDK